LLKNFVTRIASSNHHKKISDVMFRVVLGRTPTVAERDANALGLFKSEVFESRLSHMLDSEEFNIMALPGRVAQATKNWTGRRVFFLHVPKTAGTSARLALIEALGVPAFEYYNRVTYLKDEPAKLENNFWPFWVGHENISDFPNDFAGITFFRETRSRFLSLYRQYSRVGQEVFQILDPEIREETKRSSLKVLATPLGKWLSDPKLESTIGFYIPSKEYGRNSINLTEFRTYVDTLSSRKTKEILSESFSRFSHAAWSHDETGILRAVSGVSGREINVLPRENIFPNLDGLPPQVLDADTLAKLNAIQEKEAVLFKVAHEHGLIPLLSKSEADDLFEITAKRLGFTFA